MRHRVVHDYLAVDLEIVWAVVSEDLGPLIAALERIVPPQAGEPLDHAFSPSA